MKKLYFTLLLFSMLSTTLFAQTGTITGKVLDVSTHKPLPLVTVAVQGTTIGTNSDDNGVFVIKNVPPGIYNVIASAVGYQTKTKFEVEVTNSKPAYIEFEIEASATDLQEIQVKPKAFVKREESPISVRSIGVNEIQRYPGGNRDISRVIQSLPGVGFSTGFRNDLIIRGGSTAENKFYLDDIEIPNINHFSTQGGSGGPVGLINVDFIRDVNFYSSAFPANRGNMLSSAMDIKLRDGREDRWGGALTLGITESAASMEAPLNKKKTATVLASFRSSYYNWFFKLIDVSIFPNYNDAQIKVKWKITPKDEITFLSLTACDIFKLNLNANKTEAQQYTLRVIPENNQWSYTSGVKYNHYFDNSFLTVVVSRSELINKFAKYQNNDRNLAKTTDYKSTEAENKLRAEYTIRKNGWKINTGVAYELARYYNHSNFIGPYFVYNYTSTLYIHKYGAFAQVSKSVAKDKVSLSLGLRFDGNSYNKSMANLLNQVSPRFAMSVAIGKNVHWNFNTGYYHQTPAYTVFGYRDTLGNLVNQNRITYMRNLHLVTGFEYASIVV
jgi:CarboxypepD_reg-like domain/TonB-dependent Receptor Plug Domain